MRWASATALHNMGLTAYMMGDYQQALDWLHESIDADPTADPTQAWAHIGVIALDMLDLAQARHWLERAHDQVMQEPGRLDASLCAAQPGRRAVRNGELAAARQMAQASLELFEALGDSHYLPDPQLLLARIAVDEGEYATAEALATLALAQYEARNDVVLTASARLSASGVSLENGAAQRCRRAVRTRLRPAPDGETSPASV